MALPGRFHSNSLILYVSHYVIYGKNGAIIQGMVEWHFDAGCCCWLHWKLMLLLVHSFLYVWCWLRHLYPWSIPWEPHSSS
jgi:hypothetical protein